MPPFFCMCSASFQRFAVMSSKTIEDVAQKGMIICISKLLRGVLLEEFLFGTCNSVWIRSSTVSQRSWVCEIFLTVVFRLQEIEPTPVGVSNSIVMFSPLWWFWCLLEQASGTCLGRLICCLMLFWRCKLIAKDSFGWTVCLSFRASSKGGVNSPAQGLLRVF